MMSTSTGMYIAGKTRFFMAIIVPVNIFKNISLGVTKYTET